MRVLIDMQGAQSASRHRGVGRYTLALALAMARNRGGHDILLLLNGMLHETIRSIRDAFAPWLPAENIYVWHALGPVAASDPGNLTRREIAALIREDAIRKIQPDVVHITSLFDGFYDDAVHDIQQGTICPVAITFYDAIPLIQPATYLDHDARYKEHYFHCIDQAKQADLLLAISESAKSEGITYVQEATERVINISAAADPCFQPRSYTSNQVIAFKRRLKICKPFLLYSGATDERKNHRGLISAFAQLPGALRQQYQLVLAGGLPDEHRIQLQAHARGCLLAPSDVVITGRISDDDMVQLYNLCTLYVFASWHEGFGLPALEAMACGAATIGADRTSVPEVIGWRRALFNPYDASDIAKKMEEVLTDERFQHSLREHALTQAAKFSWDKSAQSALVALENLAFSVRADGAMACRCVEPSTNLLARVAKLALADDTVNFLALSQAMARNEKSAKPQLLVDVSELIQRDAKTGIQRVVRSILREWLTNPPNSFEVRAVYANTESIGYRYADRFTQYLMGLVSTADSDADAPIDYAMGDVFLVLDMQPHVQIFQNEFYQILRDNGVDVRFVLYDLLPITMPQYFPEGAKNNHEQWLNVATQADGIICISKTVAEEFDKWRRHHSPKATKKINWFHMGADIVTEHPCIGVDAKIDATLNQLKKYPTFLMVGTLEPRKGHVHVLDAADAMWASERKFNLVIVGKQGWYVDALATRLRMHPLLGEHLFWLEGVNDECLDKVYKYANCLVAASFGEGFGLPLIEAAQHKIPIIARDIPIFREVAGSNAQYFDSEGQAGLRSAMGAWLDRYADGQPQEASNISWLSWRQSAAQLLKIIEN